ncbi:hypothetical protein ACQ43C_000474 [Escherichia coli O9,30:H25]
MNYLEFPDGSLFWQQTTYLRLDMERKFEIWLDSGANIHSCKKTVVTLDDLGLSENEWNEMDQDEKDENMRDVAFETLDWGWKEI